MKSSYLIVAILFIIAVAVYLVVVNRDYAPEGGQLPAETQPAVHDAGVVHDEGWAIVPKQQNGERVYWFIAPEHNNVSPGVFRKTIHNGADGLQFTITSECEAPKPVCDRLMKQFEEISKRYN